MKPHNTMQEKLQLIGELNNPDRQSRPLNDRICQGEEVKEQSQKVHGKCIMEPIMEDEEYSWIPVKLPTLLPVPSEPPELERETGQRRRGRHIVVAIDHGPNSKHAFDWTLIHFCRLADTIHLVHAVPNLQNELVYEMTQLLMEELAIEAFQVAMVRTMARIVIGEPGKVILKAVSELRPAALVMGTRSKGMLKSVLHGSVGEYCVHNCKLAPVIIVPGREAGEKSVVEWS